MKTKGEKSDKHKVNRKINFKKAISFCDVTK